MFNSLTQWGTDKMRGAGELFSGTIDWTGRLKTFFTGLASISDWYTSSNEYIRTEGYKHLYGLILGALKPDGPGVRREQALSSLHTALKSYFSDENTLTEFNLDFEVLTHMVRVRLAPPDEMVPALNMGLFNQESRVAESIYTALGLSMLEALLPEVKVGAFLKKPLSYRELNEKLALFQHVRRLYTRESLRETKEEPVWAWTFQNTILKWIAALIHGVKMLLNVNVWPDEVPYLELAEKLYELLSWMQESGFELPTDLMQNLSLEISQCYSKQAVRDGTYTYFFESHVKTLEGLTSEKDEVHPVVKLDIISLPKQLKKDLLQIERWGRSCFKAMLCEPGDKRLENYLAVYQETRAKLTQWSQAALTLRMQAEQQLQSNTSYLQRLKALDAALMLLEKKRHEIQSSWLDEAGRFLFPDERLIESNQCLRILDGECLQKLRRVNLVHVTSFAWQRSEGKFAFEMNAQNKARQTNCFDKYRLESAYTMTDHVISEFPEVLKAAKLLSLEMHPDKRPNITCIAEYCFKELDNFRKKSLQFNRVWRKSEWFGVKEPGEIRAPIDRVPYLLQDELEMPDIDEIKAPGEALDLSVLMLHQDYLDSMQPGVDLRKRCQAVFLSDVLHSGPDFDESRLIFEGSRRTGYFCRKKGAELDVALEKADKELERLTQEAVDATEEAEAAKNKARRTLIKFLELSLKADLCNCEVVLDIEKVQSEIALIADEAMEDGGVFSREEILKEIYSLIASEEQFCVIRPHVQQRAVPQSASVVPLSTFRVAPAVASGPTPANPSANHFRLL